MTYERIKQLVEKDMAQSKPAVQSPSLWAQLGVIVCGAAVAIPDIAEVVAPVLSVPGAGYAIMAGGLVTIFRRVFCPVKPIEGLVSQK
jgi:hypothetical protein